MSERTVGRRARIELLVRSEGEDGFEVREVPSALAYLQLRPLRLEEGQCEIAQMPPGVDRKATYVLRNKATDRYLLLSEPERFLWQQMDGNTSLQEMATAYVLASGRSTST